MASRTVNRSIKLVGDFKQRIMQEVMEAIVRGAESVRDDAIAMIMSTSKTGRLYYRRGVAHRASAPGEAPANDLGNLVNSIKTYYNPADLLGKVNVGADYGAFLEYGTRKMEPRPFMRPALSLNRKEIEEDVQAAVRKALSGDSG